MYRVKIPEAGTGPSLPRDDPSLTIVPWAYPGYSAATVLSRGGTGVVSLDCRSSSSSVFLLRYFRSLRSSTILPVLCDRDVPDTWDHG
ncbi:hypothetical protein BJF89_02275 [Corynebacterium sp. CNJ-954]|uniref:hypothetical protein n=1 Tax=Corynebacterium sp. CNJ-954 TaxID=1904962 RepID=UPI000966CE7D|nr:hypothetical protein [Corynebacterium sp. CNJ-954]OLT53672.1 hypothetical protein BJF89_02275 [Corynebacterium sp. CNJ-954]